ncbi:MAG: phenylalanine--tRNA ligase subunit alpha [Clostridiales bacterium]|nr:phenylalanine--tRNA ligase subunit alpha [Clostridiales bacterium]MCD7920722.1 phenylalanine--tRNA ligase subunit alpha [Clostridiales bacterium]
MKEQLAKIKEDALAAIHAAGQSDELDAVRVKYLGKKGELTAVLKQMGKLPSEERPVMGQMANEVRAALTDAITEQSKALADVALNLKLKAETVDVTMPGQRQAVGHKHPITMVIDEVTDVFIGMGFQVVEGPEVELAAYNFTKLNTEEGHPGREWTDTFYITPGDVDPKNDAVLLRSQTSPMQVRTMETRKPPIRIVAPGRVYRKDEADATHSPMFHQIEGMAIDKGITMADLKGTLNEVVKSLYGEDAQTRFRPHHFPFTEPSCEVDVQCFECHGKGCSVCKGEGWIEVLGAGMIHPKVLEGCGIDPDVYSGWAFGMGVERLAMMRYGINNLKLCFENDVRFLEQF